MLEVKRLFVTIKVIIALWKLKDGWHFYDLAYRQVMDEVYDDILVVKGKDGESEYYAACLPW